MSQSFQKLVSMIASSSGYFGGFLAEAEEGRLKEENL
jgi:hypothetical protein